MTLEDLGPHIVKKSQRAKYYCIKIINNKVTLIIPKYGNKQKAMEFYESKKSWIISQLKTQHEPCQLPEPLSFALTEKQREDLLTTCNQLTFDERSMLLNTQYPVYEFFWENKPHLLQIQKENLRTDPHLEIKNNCLILKVGTTKQKENTPIVHLSSFTEKKELHRALSTYFSQEIESWRKSFELTLGKKATKISFSLARTRWASCSSQGHIRMNLAALLCPKHVRKTLVAHEFSHLLHMNHQKEFYQTLNQLSQSYKEDEDFLKKHTSYIFFMRKCLGL